jgi:two-component system, chemotaxis family, protein-glutamate methylesterase/glutaminase
MSEPVRQRVRVLVVDDSALMRQIMTEILSRDPGIEVVGSAADPYVAWEKIQRLTPDVLTLDVEMPRMDGLTFLEKLMRAHPMPVVMVSSLTERGCDTTLRALELGALDFITKPKVDVARGTEELAAEIVFKVKMARLARLAKRKPAAPAAPAAAPAAPAPAAGMFRGTHKIIAVGASTGGTEALREVLCALPPDSPGIVVVQHMPERFTRAFADRLNTLARIRVSEAVDGERLLPGHALIAPGNYHMELARSGADYRVRVFMADTVNRHRPSVDVLFHSVARAAGPNAVGAILTGMGDDGARGLLAMRTAGARTIAQDEATSVVFGMPKEAIALGGAEVVEPLGAIAGSALRLASAA